MKDHIYKIEVDCYSVEGKFGWKIWTREVSNESEEVHAWKIFREGKEDTVDLAWSEATYWVRQAQSARRMLNHLMNPIKVGT